MAVLTGAYAVPEVDTRATGTAELRLIGSRLHYQLHVDSLRDVTGADTLVGWAWTPGFGRKPAPGTQQEAGALAEAWVKTGAVCPN